MKTSKNMIRMGIIYAVLFGLFNLIVFFAFDTKTNVFWLSYAFVVLAFIVQIVSMQQSFKTLEIETIFFGIPLASLSVYYLSAATVIGIIFMVFQQVNFKLALVIQAIVLGVFIVIAVIALMARDAVQDIGSQFKEKVVDHRSLIVDLEMINEQCQDAELCRDLEKLIDTVKYSDPISNNVTLEIDQMVKQKITELRVYSNNNEIDKSRNLCQEIARLFSERNKKLLISK